MASVGRVYAKIDWAYRHFQSLMGEVQRYSDEEPYQVVADPQLEGDGIVTKVGHKPIPDAIPFLVGDCLQNLRSALDYLIWELVSSTNSEPSKDNQFPISRDENGFKSEIGRGRLRGTPEGVETEIEGMQPYHNGKLGESPLIVLNELANLSKHRRPILAVLTPVDVMSLITDNIGNVVHQVRCSGDQATRAFSSSMKLSGQEMKVKFEIVSCITFDEASVEGMEICQTLATLGQAVKEGVVPRFERFFERN